MASGAAATGVGLARQIGLDLGMAFQIKDDILDYAPAEQTGKSSCADLREGKITLPLIAILERCDDRERARIVEKVKAAGDDPERIAEIASFVRSEGGMEAAQKVMEEYLDRARSSNCFATISATGNGSRRIPYRRCFSSVSYSARFPVFVFSL